jgi:uncharacterized oligopeptide transporter (OPT) family protein
MGSAPASPRCGIPTKSRERVAAPAIVSPPEPATPSPSPIRVPENSARALLTGCGIGVILAAGNVYTGLKISIIDGGSITAALLGFALFGMLRSRHRTPYGALENNITQTTASSAAMGGFFAGVCGPIPALALMGHHFPGWAIALWGAALAVVGIFAATLLRRKLVVDDALPFPTGNATAEVIEAIYGARQAALRRARFLAGAAIVAGLVTWFRDARPAFIPQVTVVGGTIAGIAASALTLGVSWSPLMLSTGAMMGLRASGSMVLGALVSWVALVPWLTRTGIVSDTSFRGWSSWLVWPALGLLVAGSFVPLFIDRGAIKRTLGDLAGLFRRRSKPVGEPAPASSRASERGRPVAGPVPMLLVATTIMVVVGKTVMGLPPLVTLGALVLALLLANVTARATGETDLAPAGQAGTVTQVAVAGKGMAVSVMAGWISMGVSTQTSQTLWAFKAGHRLGASPGAQARAQILGALVGAAVVVPVYSVVAEAYGIGTETMPAIAALSWKATAEAVRGGFASLPPYGPQAGAAGMALGVLLTVLGRTKRGHLFPLPSAMGMAMLIPASLSVTALLGAIALITFRRLRPGVDESSTMALAAGGLAGESLTGVLIAILIVAGIL